jgi:hypothetical protein
MHVAQSLRRFWENDMHKTKGLKRVARIYFDAKRFKRGLAGTCLPMAAPVREPP